MYLLTVPPDSIRDCQSALVNEMRVSLSQYHYTIAHIANHPGHTISQTANHNRPIEAAVLTHQSHHIVANLPIYNLQNWNVSYTATSSPTNMDIWAHHPGSTSH
jgi:hypothetical protein